MAQFASDAFTGTDGTDLLTYSASWAKPTGATGNSRLASNRLRQTNSTAAWYYHSGTPASADYSVNVDVYNPADGGSLTAVGPTARASSGALTAYHARVNASGPTLQLYKVSAGSFSLLGSTTSFTPPSTGASKNLKLDVSGTTIGLYWDGAASADISATDSAISAAGSAGIRFANSAVPNDTTGYQLDNFSADDPAGGNLTLEGSEGALTLTGQTATANTALAGSEGTLSLAGQTATANLSLAGSEGTLTLAGQDATLSVSGALTLAGEAGSLSLTGQVSSLSTTFVGSEGSLTLTGQDSALNVVLNGSSGTLTLTGQDASLVVGGPVVLVGENGELSLTGQDAEFTLTGTKGGASKSKLKKPKKRIKQAVEDQFPLDDVIQSLEAEKNAPKIEAVVKEVVKEVLEEVKEIEEPDAVSALSLRVDLLTMKLEAQDKQLRKLQSMLDKTKESTKKQVQSLEDMIIVLTSA